MFVKWLLDHFTPEWDLLTGFCVQNNPTCVGAVLLLCRLTSLCSKILGYEQQQTQSAGSASSNQFALSISFTLQFCSFKKGNHTSQNDSFAKTKSSWSSPERTPEGASGSYYHTSCKTICLPDISKDKRHSNYLVTKVHLVQSYSEFANTVLHDSFKCFADCLELQ